MPGSSTMTVTARPFTSNETDVGMNTLPTIRLCLFKVAYTPVGSHFECPRGPLGCCPMSELGQNVKYSVRADVFRFSSKLRNCSMRSALRICANRAHDHLLPATRVSQVCGCLAGWLWQPRIYSLTKI